MIDSVDFERLRRIGLTPILVQKSIGLLQAQPTCALMRVIEVQRESLLLHDGDREHAARLLPSVRTQLGELGNALAVGDWVLAAGNAHGQCWVHACVPPTTQLARRLNDGRDKVSRTVIVSNVDTALLVMGLDQDFNPRRLERYLAMVHMAGVAAVVVLTKRDLCDQVDDKVAQVQAVLPAGMAAVAVDALGLEPAQRLEPWLSPGQTLVLLGSSGAGKSTLTNTLCGTAVADTGANRAGDSRGRHTTTVRTLHIASTGACVIDTPGLRTLRLDGDLAALDTAFDDIARLAEDCRFRDCQHAAEPGCAVRAAVGPERLRNYQKLLREARRDTLTALERKTQVAEWKARTRQGRLRAETKRG